jgi:hypothetical protein
MDQKLTLEDILAVYNSISPSRRRWIRLRNQMRNEWKELYKVLEEASGRDGGKVVVFDPNWHKVADKGGISGAVNRIFSTDTKADEGVVITEAADGDPLFEEPKQLDIVEEVTKVEAEKPAKKPVAKKKK